LNEIREGKKKDNSSFLNTMLGTSFSILVPLKTRKYVVQYNKQKSDLAIY